MPWAVTASLVRSLAQDAELVAFRVCQHNPGLISLSDINTLRAMRNQPSHLGGLVIRSEVEMQSALSALALIKPHEIESRQPIRLGADLELVGGGVDDDPAKRVGPPLPQGRRIYRMNNYLFPLQRHSPRVLTETRLPDLFVKWAPTAGSSRTAPTERSHRGRSGWPRSGS